jgi:hypothetical protein
MTRATFNPLSLLAAAALVWALVMLCAGLARAVEIPEQCRVSNRSGNCLWSNVATLGYTHGDKTLQRLAPGRKVIDDPGPNDERARSRLHRMGVIWRGYDHGDYSPKLLPLANSHGVIVSMRAGTPWLWGKSLTWNHSIILTRYDENEVEFFCPDNTQRQWRKTRQWFDGNWMGNSMVFDQHD